MLRRFLAILILAFSAVAHAETGKNTEPEIYRKARLLGIGVNLGNALEAPAEGQWGVTLHQDYFKLISEAGFDSVRLPVKFSAYAQKEPPYTLDKKILDRVDWAVAQAAKYNLAIIIDFHHYDELYQEPDAHQERFVAIWQQLAQYYQKQGETVFFELLNEPCKNLSDEQWNELIAKTLKVIRISNPDRPVIIGPTHWNNFRKLEKLKLPADDNIIVTCHYYEPFHFTHQGASWVGNESEKWLGTKWTASEAEKNEVKKSFEIMAKWAKANNRPMYIGEFGAYEKADMDSRVRWTAFVAEQARKNDFTIAYWEFCAGFGLYDKDKKQWRDELKKAFLSAKNIKSELKNDK